MMAQIDVDIEQLAHAEGLPLPQAATAKSAGVDLIAALPADQPMNLAPWARGLVPTGLKIALPDGFEAQIRPRSGLALKSGITVLNSPGTIDADYRGEIQIILANLSTSAFAVERGMRIAQMVIAPIASFVWRIRTIGADESGRGGGGFGSTGVSDSPIYKNPKKGF